MIETALSGRHRPAARVQAMRADFVARVRWNPLILGIRGRVERGRAIEIKLRSSAGRAKHAAPVAH